MEQDELIAATLGCYTKSSECRLSHFDELPGVHWVNNCACWWRLVVKRHTNGTTNMELICPVCGKQLILAEDVRMMVLA